MKAPNIFAKCEKREGEKKSVKGDGQGKKGQKIEYHPPPQFTKFVGTLRSKISQKSYNF